LFTFLNVLPKLYLNVYAIIINLFIYDYYLKSKLHLDDIYIRKNGLTLDANQIKGGHFTKDVFTFNSNLNIGVLHVIGPNNNSLIKKINYYKIYYKNFIKFHNYLSLKQRNKILKKSKYGLHFSHDEHFGRAILEMTKFRLIVFAENSGGCREILLNSFQKYKSLDDLIIKLSKVMQSKIIRKKIFNLVFKNLNKEFTDLNFKNELKKYLVY
jgi:hypothetical protein